MSINTQKSNKNHNKDIILCKKTYDAWVKKMKEWYFEPEFHDEQEFESTTNITLSVALATYEKCKGNFTQYCRELMEDYLNWFKNEYLYIDSTIENLNFNTFIDKKSDEPYKTVDFWDEFNLSELAIAGLRMDNMSINEKDEVNTINSIDIGETLGYEPLFVRHSLIKMIKKAKNCV